jgi:hypothetical protein
VTLYVQYEEVGLDIVYVKSYQEEEVVVFDQPARL